MDEVLDIAAFVAQVLDRLGIRHVIVGSFASSFHGVPRATQDVDFVADLVSEQVQPLVDALSTDFYVDGGAIEEAIQHGTRFNAIHLATMFKVDVYLPAHRPGGGGPLERAKSFLVSPERDLHLRLASPEDTIAHKLYWYRLGDQVADRQWRDALGILRVQRATIDHPYLREASARLEVTDLLDELIDESGRE